MLEHPQILMAMRRGATGTSLPEITKVGNMDHRFSISFPETVPMIFDGIFLNYHFLFLQSAKIVKCLCDFVLQPAFVFTIKPVLSPDHFTTSKLLLTERLV